MTNGPNEAPLRVTDSSRGLQRFEIGHLKASEGEAERGGGGVTGSLLIMLPILLDLFLCRFSLSLGAPAGAAQVQNTKAG